MLTRRQIPNLLTFARLAAVPVSLGLMLAPTPCAPVLLLWIFVVASLTDFLDGYLARKWGVVTPLGALLDPIADKLIVALMLVYLLLAGDSTLLFLPVIIILLRELYISGLREFLAGRNIALPVSKSGKWKTALQMVAIIALLAQLAYGATPLHCLAPFVAAFDAACRAEDSAIMQTIYALGLPLLYLSALLAFTSALSYSRAAFSKLKIG